MPAHVLRDDCQAHVRRRPTRKAPIAFLVTLHLPATAQVAIEQLQSELMASRKEEQAVKEEAGRIYEDQAGQLRLMEENVRRVEQQLLGSNTLNQTLQGRVQHLEMQLGEAQKDQQASSSTMTGRMKDKDRQAYGAMGNGIGNGKI